MISPETLTSNRKHLKDNIARLTEVLEKHPYPGTITSGDKEERAGAYNAKEVERQNHAATKALLEDCEAALKRMDDGTYGICVNVDCGKEINEDRLTARPEASRCIECQEKKGLRVR